MKENSVNCEGTVVNPLAGRWKHSPDFHDLIRKPYHCLFVYDSLGPKGAHNKVYLEDAKYLGPAQTIAGLYKMYKNDWLPIVHEVEIEDRERAAIRGHAYLVSPEHFLGIDTHQQNGKMFRRDRVRIFLDAQNPRSFRGHTFQSRPWLNAWYYRGNPDYPWATEVTWPEETFTFVDKRQNERLMYEWKPKIWGRGGAQASLLEMDEDPEWHRYGGLAF